MTSSRNGKNDEIMDQQEDTERFPSITSIDPSSRFTLIIFIFIQTVDYSNIIICLNYLQFFPLYDYLCSSSFIGDWIIINPIAVIVIIPFVFCIQGSMGWQIRLSYVNDCICSWIR